MKNIEKIAIDTLIDSFAIKNRELIDNAVSAKSAADMAVANFKKAASLISNGAKQLAEPLVEDDISQEAIEYFETKISEITKLHFKIKN